MNGLLHRLFQLIRRARYFSFRLVRHVYWNASPGTQIDLRAHIDSTAIIEIETIGAVIIGPQTRINAFTVLAPYGGSIRIGRNVYVGNHCVLFGHGGLVIGDDTMIAAHAFIIPMSHNFADPKLLINQQGEQRLGVNIGKDCWIGAGVQILDGVTIGDGCVIGAGSVVRESIPPMSIAAGAPARIIGTRGENTSN